MSLTVKLTLAFLLVSLAGIALVALFAGAVAAREFDSFVAAQNEELLVNQLAAFYEENGGWRGRSLPPLQQLNQRRPDGARLFAVADERGVTVIPGVGLRAGRAVPPDALKRGAPIEVNGRQVGTLILPFPGPPRLIVNEVSRRINRALFFAALGAGSVALLLGFILSRTLTRPLQEITAATQKVAAGDLSQEVPVRSDDELGQLAASFNRMSRQLTQSRDMRRQMTADIAHDLRTPLSLILGHTEALRDGVLPPSQETFDVLHDEAKRLDRLVTDLRTLSLADAGELSVAARPVAPQLLLERAIVTHTPRAEKKRIALTLEVEPDLPEVLVDPDRMGQVLDNLVENGIRYTPENGRITLSASRSEYGVRLQVQDTGPGLSPEEVEHVFDRFYRGDKSRQRQEDGGSGLGLAIARSLVLAQNGRIRAESQLGEGATFIVELPGWTESWQSRIREAEADIQAGRVKRATEQTIDTILEWLDE
ncbi:MAG TPA: HAMP domain-containing protein [Anaerolineae bacterium]|nr:HAMP domain-containing protein [Anaerolineae bacterium]